VLAAVGASRALTERPPEAVVLLGTCGAYENTGLSPGTVVVSRRVHLVEPLALSRAAEFPPPMPTSLDADARLIESLAAAGARPADIATTLAITVDDRAAAFTAQATATQVEHLEAFAVATACAALRVRFVAVLGVANRVGARARTEWRANHVQASEQAAGVALRWLCGGAVGLVG
jgi:nucleoside phosphorylase